MEEFLYRESNDIHKAIMSGTEISWPSHCRNCDFKFTQELKTEVYSMLKNNPSLDMLYIVSLCFRTKCSGFNYCCINNYRPSFETDLNLTKKPGVVYHVFTKSLVIEDGLDDWHDVTWDGDDDKPETLEIPEENTLFDLIEGLGT